MNGPGTLAEKGEKVSRFVAKLRAARRQQSEPVTKPAFRAKGARLPDDWLYDPRNLWMNGYWRYMLDREERVIDEARQRIAAERPHWRQHSLEMVESHLARETDPEIVAGLKRELRKVRRALGLVKPTPEMVVLRRAERVQAAPGAREKRRPI